MVVVEPYKLSYIIFDQDELEEVERQQKQLALERHSLVKRKDDAGKNVHSLAKAK